jgi:histone H3/H4
MDIGDSPFGDDAQVASAHGNGHAHESGSDTDYEEPARSQTQKMTREKSARASAAEARARADDAAVLAAAKKRAAAAAKTSAGKAAQAKAAKGKALSLHDRKKAALSVQKGAGQKGKAGGKGAKTGAAALKAAAAELAKARTFCFAVRAKRAVIRALKPDHEFYIPRAAAQRLIDEVAQAVADEKDIDGLRIQGEARVALHYALEDFMCKEFSQANMFAENAKRMTLFQKDFHSLRKLRANAEDGLIYLNKVGDETLKSKKAHA